MAKSKDEIKLERINRIKTYLKENPEKRDVKNRFIERFVFCEMICKATILDYWHSEGKKLDKEDTEGIKLRPESIMKALGSESEYDFTEDFLLRMFGGKDNKKNPYKNKGCYSVKMLRDKITHELLISAIDELYERRTEISKLMDDYTAKFNTET